MLHFALIVTFCGITQIRIFTARLPFRRIFQKPSAKAVNYEHLRSHPLETAPFMGEVKPWHGSLTKEELPGSNLMRPFEKRRVTLASELYIFTIIARERTTIEKKKNRSSPDSVEKMDHMWP